MRLARPQQPGDSRPCKFLRRIAFTSLRPGAYDDQATAAVIFKKSFNDRSGVAFEPAALQSRDNARFGRAETFQAGRRQAAGGNHKSEVASRKGIGKAD